MRIVAIQSPVTSQSTQEELNWTAYVHEGFPDVPNCKNPMRPT